MKRAVSRRGARAIVGLAVMAAYTACRATGSIDERGPVPITVTNELSRGAATVYVVPPNGIPSFLGTVLLAETKTFTYGGETIAERLRLRAVFPDGSALTSEPFIIPQNSRAEWSLLRNRLTTPKNEAPSPPPAGRSLRPR